MKYTLFACLLFIKTTYLFSQRHPTDQHELLAEHQVKECRTYRPVFRNHQPTADSILMTVSQYNSYGYVSTHTQYDTPGDKPLRYEHAYLSDTLEIKITGYKSNNEVYFREEYRYDERGNRIETIHHSNAGRDGTWKTYSTSLTYDNMNHITAVYTNSNKENDSRLLSKFEYDAEGRKRSVYFYGGSLKKPLISETEYDAQGRASRYYTIKKGKRKPTGTCTYNDKGQLLVQDGVFTKTERKYFGVIGYRTKKTGKIRTEYAYNEKGLLQKEDRYENGKLVSRKWYTYAW